MKMKDLTLIAFLVVGVISNTCYGAGGSVGGSSSDHSDDVHKDPEDLKRVFMGHWFTLDCSSLNASADVPLKWFKDTKEITAADDRFTIFKENSSLLVTAAEASDVTKFQCRGENSDGDALSREITVYELNFKDLPKSTTVQEGDKLSIVCEVSGNPPPAVRWYKDDSTVQSVFNKSENRLTLSPNDHGINEASLRLDGLTEEDHGQYTCKVYIPEREEPVRVSSTLVRVKSIYAALWPFLGIVCEVVVLCLIIFVYERRRTKNDMDESDTDQDDKKDNQ